MRWNLEEGEVGDVRDEGRGEDMLCLAAAITKLLPKKGGWSARSGLERGRRSGREIKWENKAVGRGRG